ncbi:MAG: archaeosortase/exosortase family protein [Acidobacteriota bacterium]|nr:MAG: archaeosortase/exosortase family protein [Acidobacteriota bacterium]
MFWQLGDSSRTLNLGLALVFGLILGLGFFDVFQMYAVTYWNTDALGGLYSMAPFLAVALLIVLWKRRDLLLASTGPHMNRWIGYGILILGVLIKLHAEIEGYAILRGASLIPILLGVVLILFSAQTVRGLFFPILFIIMIIPLPTFVIDNLTRPMLGATAEVTDYFLSISGLSYTRWGNSFVLEIASGFHEVQIVQGCSGIQSLFSLLSVFGLFLLFRKTLFQYKVILFLAVVPLALLGNFARVIVTVLLITFISPEAGDGFFHGASGLVMFCLVLLVLFFLDWLIVKQPLSLGQEA